MAVSYIIPQPYNKSLSSISVLTGTSGLLKKVGPDSYELDNSQYLKGVVTISQGGTGATSKENALINLLPDAVPNSYLRTNGELIEWEPESFISYIQPQSLTIDQVFKFRTNVLVGSNPILQYNNNDVLETITYSDGSIKRLFYNGNGDLIRTEHEYLEPVRTVVKELSYDSGKLVSVVESIEG